MPSNATRGRDERLLLIEGGPLRYAHKVRYFDVQRTVYTATSASEEGRNAEPSARGTVFREAMFRRDPVTC